MNENVHINNFTVSNESKILINPTDLRAWCLGHASFLQPYVNLVGLSVHGILLLNVSLDYIKT